MVDIVINDYVKKITISLEALTIDLDEKKEELNNKKEYCERVSRFLAYTSGDINLVGIYADQELIYENLDKIGKTKESYKASCYLLRSSEDSVKSLPQYKEASEFILSLISHFKMMKSDLLSEIQCLEKECHKKRNRKEIL